VSEATVGAGFARGLLDFAVGRGVDRRTLAGRAGLDLEAVADQDRRIPFPRYVALMRAAKDLTGDPALALRYGEQVDIAEVSIVGLIGLAAETMLEALGQLNRYVPLIVETANGGSGERFQLVRDRDGLWLVDARLDGGDFPELTESAFAQLVSGPRRIGAPPFVQAVEVTHADPGYRAEYERIFQAPVSFGAARNALRIAPGWVEHRVERLPRYVFGVLTGRADELMESLASEGSTRGRVEACLLRRLHTGEAAADAVARSLGMSRQTLYRRLKAEGASFEQVLAQLRRRLARDYLAGGRVSVGETAYLLGFSDPAAFSRAFKRWTGMSPSEARNRSPYSGTAPPVSGRRR
jgi:AraC-like DNA-binding protein